MLMYMYDLWVVGTSWLRRHMISKGGPLLSEQPYDPEARASGESASGLAIASLIAGVASWLMCPLIAAIAGAIMGKMELDNIDRGESPEAGRTPAMIGFWASVANIILWLFNIALFIASLFMAFSIPFITPEGGGG